MDLQRVEKELKKRWIYPYVWGRRQSNSWDYQTNFIYKTYSVNSLLKKSEYFSDEKINYALNRWYNFWSAMAVEDIFCSHENIIANKNPYNKLIDFKINNIPFDHKTSIFPKGFSKNIEYAKDNEKELIIWLYKNQSQEGRKHYKNRLFIVLYDSVQQKHWQIKAEIDLLKKAINQYVKNFSKENLYSFDFGEGNVYSDILWIVK